MTAISTRPLSDSTDSLLRFAIRLDATLTGLGGLVMAAAAGPLSSLTGLTPTHAYALGAAFVLYGAVVYLLAARPALRSVGIAVVVANIVCTVAAVAVVAAGVFPLTGAGMAVILGCAVYTAVFAELQYVGVRRLA
ncbi:hypothetical protein BH09ACT8_BH09ACT8_31520 [soil metagenome]